MKIVYFVRHGQSQANVDKVFAGSQLDSFLTVKGIRQADAAAQALEGKPFDIIVSSPLLRAQATARRIAKQLGYNGEILTEALLAERDFGEASGKRWDEVGALVDSGGVGGLETPEQLAGRMRQLLSWFAKHEATYILAVGHGTAEGMLQTIYLGRPHHTFLETKELGNAEVREYRIL